jgi:hypothetical protein
MSQSVIPLIYDQKQINAIVSKTIDDERKRSRKTIRKMWFITMCISVMIAASIRRQQFVDLEWWWVPAIAVSLNALCWWFAVKIWFGKVR